MDLDKLSRLQIFSRMDKSELKTLTGNMETLSFRKGEQIFQKSDPGGTVYIVMEGNVQISAALAPDLKKSLLNLPPGGVFGELSLFTMEDRSADAEALTDTRLLAMDTKSFNQILEEVPVAGGKLLAELNNIISDRLRNMTDMYCQALNWSLSVSGAIELHMDQLISNNVDLTVKLINGEACGGRLLKIEEHAAGYVLFLQSEDGKLEVIPYHAVISMSFDKGAFQIKPTKGLL